MDQTITFSAESLQIARIAIAIFFGILFIQSGLDKVFNFRENLSWLVTHFKDTFMSGIVPVIFLVITISETAAGLISAYGAIDIYIHKTTNIALLGMELSALSLIFLFFGQRIAKDYAGAGSLVSYFTASIIGILLLS
jgi:putative oxidoreductase